MSSSFFVRLPLALIAVVVTLASPASAKEFPANTVLHREAFSGGERCKVGKIGVHTSPRKWVICLDGTANSPTSQTNVVWVYESVIGMLGGTPRKDVIGYYDSGVGTTDGETVRGSLFGKGFSKNTQQIAWTLARFYQPGDSIYLFGFSRGSMQALELVGFLRVCGIVPGSEKERAQADVKYLYEEVYGTMDDSRQPDGFRAQGGLSPQEPRLSPKAAARLAAFDARGGPKRIHPRIAYLGLWDPVDAMGWRAPGLLSLTYEALEKNVARHGLSHNIWLAPEESRGRLALSLDDRRGVYFPVIPAQRRGQTQGLEAAWFAGDHCDCGGGHPPANKAVMTSLQWRFNETDHLANVSYNWLLEPVAGEILPPGFAWRLREPKFTNENPGLRHDLISHFLFKSSAERIRKEMYVDQTLEGLPKPVTGIRANVWPRAVHESAMKRMALTDIPPHMEPEEIWEYSLLRRKDNGQPLRWVEGRDGRFRLTLSVLAFAPRRWVEPLKTNVRYVPVPFRQLAWPAEKIPAALKAAGLTIAR
ncbi:MAG: phospholipase effector Tle1 domain-containing protein [Prosthecobacter sp.]